MTGALADRRAGVTWPLLAMALAFALLLAGPGRTVTTVYVNDLFIFLDGAHRIVSGQVPNRDFHTALGPLVYYLPGLGLWLSGSLGAALPIAMALMVLAVAPVLAHVLRSRLDPVIALLLGAFLLLILAVPLNLGESIAGLTFAMFYNRVGWAALGILLVMYLRPETASRHQGLLDALSAAFLALVMLYTKITYGLVALAFLGFMLFDRAQRRWAAAALGLVLVAGLVVELLWRSTGDHVADLLLTGRVSGLRGLPDLVYGVLRHLADYVLFAMFAVLALRRTRSLRDLLFFGFCAGPGLLIVSQNSQPWGIITLHAGAAVGAEMLVRAERSDEREAAVSLDRSAPWLLVAFLLPTALHCLMALVLHAGLALAKAGEPLGLPKFADIRLALLWSPGDYDFSKAYLDSIRSGAKALSGLEVEPTRVSVLDFASPFSAGLGLPPPRGDFSWLHWGRNVDETNHLPPERLLAGVEVLMEPSWGVNTLPLQGLYGDYVKRNFQPIRKTEAWTVHLRRRQQAGQP